MVARLPSFDLGFDIKSDPRREGGKQVKISLQEVDRIRQSQSVSRVNGNGTNGNGKSTGINGHTSAASVEVSATAQEIQRVKKLVNSVPDVRDDVVQSV